MKHYHGWIRADGDWKKLGKELNGIAPWIYHYKRGYPLTLVKMDINLLYR
jgi:hypothetical protein